MSGDGFGAPPWGPADPVPQLEDTQAIPGLGSVPEPAGGAQGGQGHRQDNGYGDAFRPAEAGGQGTPEVGGPAAGSHATHEPAGNGLAGSGEAASGLAGSGEAASGPAGSGEAASGPALNGPAVNGEAGTAGAGGGTGGAQDPPGKTRQGKGGHDGKHRHGFLRELPVLVIVTLTLALLIKAFVAQAFWIPSGSMENTLDVNDKVFVNKVVYHLRPIHRGDIVVFDGTNSWDFGTPSGSHNIFAKGISEIEGLVGISNDPNIYIKRVIGIPGDHVVCCDVNGDITVNGVAVHEGSYLYPGNAPSAQKFNVTVPAGRLWVMGDHRLVSYDSRGHMGDPGGGTIPESGVIGRAFMIIWPPSRWRILNIPATFQQPKLNASIAAPGNAAAAVPAASLDAALLNGTPLRQSATPVPLALGFVGALPVTWLQRKLRTRRRKSRRSAAAHGKRQDATTRSRKPFGMMIKR